MTTKDQNQCRPVVVLISANAEWRVLKELLPNVAVFATPFGEAFEIDVNGCPVPFVHGGWGKISAAASTQWALMKWQPGLVVNLGTCGGFSGSAEVGDIMLVNETLVYDIFEAMGDPQEAIDFYATQMDLSWLPQPYPQPVKIIRLVSADRDIIPTDIPMLKEHYSAVAGDWESGAIAWTAQRSGARCLILRGVTDLVGDGGGEVYGKLEMYHQRTRGVMKSLLEALPDWIR